MNEPSSNWLFSHLPLFLFVNTRFLFHFCLQCDSASHDTRDSLWHVLIRRKPIGWGTTGPQLLKLLELLHRWSLALRCRNWILNQTTDRVAGQRRCWGIKVRAALLSTLECLQFTGGDCDKLVNIKRTCTNQDAPLLLLMGGAETTTQKVGSFSSLTNWLCSTLNGPQWLVSIFLLAILDIHYKKLYFYYLITMQPVNHLLKSVDSFFCLHYYSLCSHYYCYYYYYHKLW